MAFSCAAWARARFDSRFFLYIRGTERALLVNQKIYGAFIALHAPAAKDHCDCICCSVALLLRAEGYYAFIIDENGYRFCVVKNVYTV